MGADPTSTVSPAGREILFEHVHFDWNGSYQLARLMAQSSATALFGEPRNDAGWLDSAACADALAYTPHERLPMLLRIDILTRKPPFTNQLTYSEDESRMSQAIDEATRNSRRPATLDHAARVAKAALTRDPNDPALAGILEGIELDRGNLPEALALARRAEQLLPRDFALSADEASILMRLNRFPEADTILMQAAASGADLDLLAPVLVDFWTSGPGVIRGVDERFFDRAIATEAGPT